MTTMKALTICNPYPRFILNLEKPVENRNKRTHYRGPLLIHAGKSRTWMDDEDEADAARAGDPLVFGAIVGIATLADCLRIEDIEAGKFDLQYPQLASRAHCGGPFCLVLTDVIRFDSPIQWRGAQGYFNVPLSVLPEWARSRALPTASRSPTHRDGTDGVSDAVLVLGECTCDPFKGAA